MFKNYLLIAWRQIVKNKLYATINILGLVTGLVVYVFGSLLVNYEESHDRFFANADRIFTAGTIFGPNSGVGVKMTDSVYTALGPLIKADAEEIEAMARTVRREFLVSVEDDHYYENLKFADPALLQIFDFNYIEGDASALEDPSGVLVTETYKTKLFGEGNALGKTLQLDHDVTLHVSGVIQDLPLNSHFTSSIVGTSDGFGIIAPLAALNRATDYDLAGNWGNLSMGDNTYFLFPEGTTREHVQGVLDGAYEAHFTERQSSEFIPGLAARTLDEANTFRKTMGAARQQLLVQFLVESVCIVTISMLIAFAALELVVPIFNEASGRGLTLDYATMLPWLFATTIVVGLISGAYPAYLITRTTPIDALHESGKGAAKGGLFRSIMLGLQFTISIFMLAMVIVVYFQNQKVVESSQMYPRSQILTLQRLGVDEVQDRKETLRNELLKIEGVEDVAFSSQVPYEQSTSSFGVGPELGDEENQFSLMQIGMDDHFLETYNIPLLAGRNLRDVSADTLREGVLEANVVVNELALDKLGFGSPQEALGKMFYDFPDERESRAYTIVGVVPDQNFQGFHNEIKPMAYTQSEQPRRIGSVRVAAGVPMHGVLSSIEDTWRRLIPEYPIQTEFLDAVFGEVFDIFNLTTRVLGGFAAIALLLSMIGLFGLAAFMAQSRTKEIGIRKVMGANIQQIVRLLIWQFSRPVMWSLLFALPLAYFASDTYLNFFADRISAPAGIVAGAGILAIAFAWSIVAIHAVRIARANPIHALRYE
jgi:putative ABC transport system permease protein